MPRSKGLIDLANNLIWSDSNEASAVIKIFEPVSIYSLDFSKTSENKVASYEPVLSLNWRNAKRLPRADFLSCRLATTPAILATKGPASALLTTSSKVKTPFRFKALA